MTFDDYENHTNASAAGHRQHKDLSFEPQHQCQSRVTSTHIQSFGIRAASSAARCGQARAWLTCGIHEGSLRTAITLGLPTTTSHRAISRVVRHSSSHCCKGSPQVIKLFLLLQDFDGYSLIPDQAFCYCSIQ